MLEMKQIRSLFVGLIAIVALLATTNAFSEPKLTVEELKSVVSTLKTMLPMKVADGMSWTSAATSSDDSTVILIFKISPSEMDCTLEEAKTEFNNFSNREFQILLGNEFNDMMNHFGYPFEIRLNYPDGTSKSYFMHP